MSQPAEKRAILADLAKEVGVSCSTASRALRNVYGVNPKVRTRVERVARRLNYVPNQHARSLSTGKTNLIGLATPPIRNMTPQEDCLSLIEAAAEADGKRLVRVSYKPSECSTLLNIALGQQWQGLLLVPDRQDKDVAELGRGLKKFGIPMVTFRLGPDDAEGVRMDVAHGVRLILDHARERGFRRIGVVDHAATMRDLSHAWKFNSLEDDLRIRGLELAATVGYEPDIPYGPALYKAAYKAFEEALVRGLDVDLVIGANDIIALAVMNCLGKHGRRVPDNVAVSGYDDTEHAQYSQPPLTSIRWPREEMVELAWDMLRRRVRGDAGEPRVVTLSPTLVARESTSPKRPRPAAVSPDAETDGAQVVECKLQGDHNLTKGGMRPKPAERGLQGAITG